MTALRFDRMVRRPGAYFGFGFAVHGVYVLESEFDEVITWCTKQFGPTHPKSAWQQDGFSCVYFRHPEDAMNFKMRWG